MYADDSSIAAFGNTPKEAATALNTCLNHVAHWFSINRLIIHPSESNIMVVGTKAKTIQVQNLDVKINNISVNKAKNVITNIKAKSFFNSTSTKPCSTCCHR